MEIQMVVLIEIQTEKNLAGWTEVPKVWPIHSKEIKMAQLTEMQTVLDVMA